jgi:hypothetical protein
MRDDPFFPRLEMVGADQLLEHLDVHAIAIRKGVVTGPLQHALDQQRERKSAEEQMLAKLPEQSVPRGELPVRCRAALLEEIAEPDLEDRSPAPAF